ncbi:MAG: hypothetical protein HYW80_01115 [Parcubacteria group bacterium]|nr:hypothetical protein [Parcubacteria group bacterium]
MQDTILKSGISLFLFQDEDEETSSPEMEGDDLEKDLPGGEEVDGDWRGEEAGEESEGLPEV